MLAEIIRSFFMAIGIVASVKWAFHVRKTIMLYSRMKKYKGNRKERFMQMVNEDIDEIIKRLEESVGE